MKPVISVLICTWNRADGLRDALEALNQQAIAHSEFEVIVVDNNSTDNTAEVVSEVAKAMPFQLTYLLEKRQGKCWALNLGIHTARADIVACIDDDCTPDPNWLGSIIGEFKKTDVDVMGGPALSVFTDSVISDRNKLFLANRFFGDFAPYDKFTEIFDKNPPLGMNMSFKKEVALAIGCFDVNLGPRPQCHIGREETAFVRNAQQAGYRVFYTPDAVINHHVEDKRISWAAVRKQAFFSGIGASRQRQACMCGSILKKRVLLSMVYMPEMLYSFMRSAVFFALPQKRAVALFRGHSALGKLYDLWLFKRS